jgi:hypothetical protein
MSLAALGRDAGRQQEVGRVAALRGGDLLHRAVQVGKLDGAEAELLAVFLREVEGDRLDGLALDWGRGGRGWRRGPLAQVEDRFDIVLGASRLLVEDCGLPELLDVRR